MRLRPLSKIAAIAAGVALVAPAVAIAAAPRYIIAHDGPLAEPVVLSDWEANLRLLTESKAGAVVSPTELTGRDKISLALFWGPEWAEYADRTNVAAPPIEEANGGATVYVATDGAPAAIETVFDGVREARVMPAAAVAVLEQAGVPVTGGNRSSTSAGGTFDNPALLIAILAICAASVAVLARWARRSNAPPHGATRSSPIGTD
jgi:hypothetical protein